MKTYEFVVKLTVDASHAETREYVAEAISRWGGTWDSGGPFSPNNFEVAIKRSTTRPINACYTRSIEVLNAKIKEITRERDEARADYARRHQEATDLFVENITLKADRDEARNKALDEVRLIATGWRERDYPEGFDRTSAQHLADQFSADILALKTKDQTNGL